MSRKNQKIAPLESDEKSENIKIGYIRLFRYATSADVFLIIFGTFAAIATGLGYPLVVS